MGFLPFISDNPIVRAVSRVVTWGSIILVAAMAVLLLTNPDQFFSYVNTIIATITNGINYIIDGIVSVIRRFLAGIEYYAYYIATELGQLVRNIISWVGDFVTDILAQIDPRNWDIDLNPF